MQSRRSNLAVPAVLTFVGATLGAGACSSFDAAGTPGGAGAGADGGADEAAAPPEAGTTPFVCPASADVVFCDDFERAPDRPPFDWDQAEPGNDATTWAVSAGAGTLGSRGLRVSSTGAGNTWLRRKLPDMTSASQRAYELDLDVLVESLASRNAIVAALWLTAPTTAEPIGLRADEDPAPALVAVPASAGAPFAKRPFGAWHHVHVELTPAAGPHARKIAVDGVPIATDTFDISALPYPDVRIGIYYASGQAASVAFDNVVARVRD